MRSNTTQLKWLSQKRIGPSHRPGVCPALNARGDGNEILVPAGMKKSIKVKVHIFDQLMVQARFICRFKLEGRVVNVTAQLLSDTVYCDEMEFASAEKSPNATAQFDVIWGGRNALDNPDNIHGERAPRIDPFHEICYVFFWSTVNIYRCSAMASDTVTCTSLPDEYDCGWCPSLQKCTVRDECSTGNDWIRRAQLPAV